MTSSLASDLATALDPVRLAQRAGLQSDPWQADVLRSAAKQMILLASRQSGKSTVSAVLAAHTAMFQPGSLVLVLSPSLRQSQELFRKITDVYKAAGRSVPASTETKLSLELENGSRIVSLPGSERTIRGFSGVALLLVDEASRVDDALYASIRPMLAVSGGRIVLLSTPFGKRGFFYKEWEQGGPGWHRARITAYDVPRIDPAWLAEERERIGERWFQQEYNCQFVETEDQLFPNDDIESAFDPEAKPLFSGGIFG